MDIDYYINASKNMKNTSDGGSCAYHFDDVVLIKYTCPNKYGIARSSEEEVAKIANEKRKNGIRTPYHLAIKRVTEGEENICYVLQERAKGVSFSNYCNHKTADEQLEVLKKLLDAPDSHFENCIRDLCNIYNMGIEIKPKNIFYDESRENGGFTFIDLLEPNPNTINYDSLADIINIDLCMLFIYSFASPSSFLYDMNESQIENKELYSALIRKRIFSLYDKVIPNFDKYRRWLLRTYKSNFIRAIDPSSDLTLDDSESVEFYKHVDELVDSCIEKISSGKKNIQYIELNDIGNDLTSMGLNDSWKFHRDSSFYSSNWNTCDMDYDTKRNLDKELYSIAHERLCMKLNLLSVTTTNQNILDACSFLEQEKNKTR